jgi:mRNA interferase MazF
MTPILNQGDVYWLHSVDGVPHPHVIIQDNALNHSDIDTVVVCPLTTNSRKATMPGNVSLEIGEAGLTKPSIVEVSKSYTVTKAQLREYVGAVSPERVIQILAGIQFLRKSFFGD